MISLYTVPFFTFMAEKLGVMDVPDNRKIHTGRVPRLGGLGVVTAVLVVYLIVGDFSKLTIWYVVANAVIIATGLADDVFDLPAKVKFAGQIVAALITIFLAGVLFPFGMAGGDLGYIISVMLSLLWIVGVTNAVNFMDGMDGLASGISFMAFGAMAVGIASKGLDYYCLMSFAFMGGILGFMRYNMPPAKVFMGDTGSLFMGFNIAAMALAVSYKSGTLLSLFVPFLYISLPVFDTFLAIIRRLRRGESPFSPDNEHIHHRILGLEFSTQQSLIIFYAVSIALNIIAVMSYEWNLRTLIFASILLLYILLILIKLFDIFNLRTAIRSVNQWVSKAAKDAEIPFDGGYVKIVNRAVAVLTIFLMLFFMYKYDGWDIERVKMLIIFLFILSFIVVARRILQVRNDFIAFLIFWIYFYVVFYLYHMGFVNLLAVSAFSMGLVVLIKAILLKRWGLFFSNPMEFIMIFSIIIMWKFSGAQTKDMFLISLITFVIYYGNKVYFSRGYSYFKYYLLMLALLILFAPLRFYVSFLTGA